jgi:hypothetical protein
VLIRVVHTNHLSLDVFLINKLIKASVLQIQDWNDVSMSLFFCDIELQLIKKQHDYNVQSTNDTSTEIIFRDASYFFQKQYLSKQFVTIPGSIVAYKPAIEIHFLSKPSLKNISIYKRFV